jgi:hypothetical protein
MTISPVRLGPGKSSRSLENREEKKKLVGFE